jgi:phage shock protein C
MARGRLMRPRQGKMIAGVCAGLANFYGWDVTLVRIVFVLFGFFGAGELVYIVLWILTPKER